MKHPQVDCLSGMHIRVAGRFLDRLVGLLGSPGLPAHGGILLLPCNNVHTAFMRFPIDIVFVDRTGVVVKVVQHVRPFRLAAAWRAHACLELAAGAAGSRGIVPGVHLPSLGLGTQ